MQKTPCSCMKNWRKVWELPVVCYLRQAIAAWLVSLGILCPRVMQEPPTQLNHLYNTLQASIFYGLSSNWKSILNHCCSLRWLFLGALAVATSWNSAFKGGIQFWATSDCLKLSVQGEESRRPKLCFMGNLKSRGLVVNLDPPKQGVNVFQHKCFSHLCSFTVKGMFKRR